MITKTRVLVALLLGASIVQASEKDEIYDTYEIPAFKTHDLKELKLLHSSNSFSVFDKGKVKKVNPCWVDKEIRTVSVERLGKLLEHGYLSVNKMSDGEFKVQAHARGEGGGVLGATGGAIFGKFLVHFIGHGVIQIAALCTGPAYPVTVLALEAALLPIVIEPLSNVAAIGCGILGGVATGPV